MKKVINELIQLQELIAARAQHAQTQDGRLSQLNKSIASMLSDLPDDLRSHIDRLQKKDLVIIAPMYNNACSACGMVLPVSETHIVKGGKVIHRCPACSRILYFPGEAGPRRKTGVQAPRQPKAAVERYSGPHLMIPRLESADTESAIAELAGAMETANYFDSAVPLVDLAMKREAIASTALSHGLAFPHVRGVEGGGLTMSIGMHPKGFRFGPDQKELTRLIFFIVIPTAASAFYLRLLAGLTSSFDPAGARKAMLECETPEAMWKMLIKLTRKAI